MPDETIEALTEQVQASRRAFIRTSAPVAISAPVAVGAPESEHATFGMVTALVLEK